MGVCVSVTDRVCVTFPAANSRQEIAFDKNNVRCSFRCTAGARQDEGDNRVCGRRQHLRPRRIHLQHVRSARRQAQGGAFIHTHKYPVFHPFMGRDASFTFSGVAPEQNVEQIRAENDNKLGRGQTETLSATIDIAIPNEKHTKNLPQTDEKRGT